MSRLEIIKERLEQVNTKRGIELYDARETFSAHAEADMDWLIERLERYESALKDAKKALDHQYQSNGGIIENNKAYMAIFNALQE